MYITFMCDSLVLIGSRQGKKIFSKCFDVRSEADVIYYTVSCNQMLNPEVVVLASIEHEAGSFSWPETQVLKIDQYLALPSLSTLLATYRACVS